MPSESTPLLSQPPAKGTWVAPTKNDTRSPCPIVNSLANHGYIPRNGRNVHAGELNAAMDQLGLSKILGAILSRSIFNEYQDPRKPSAFLARIWYYIRNPWAILSKFGMRRLDQVDAAGHKVLNLDQLALHGVVEHDISNTRRDALQKEGNLTPQYDLISEMLACSSDGGKSLTMEDLCTLRKRRIQTQLEDNPGLTYGKKEHGASCAEIALILKTFGNGRSIPCEYARAVFQEERLPTKEGWARRWWWTLGILELGPTVKKVKALIGLDL